MIASRRALLAAAALCVALPLRPGRAQSGLPVIRLGVLNDQSGPYRDLTAPSLPCVQQAIEDFDPASKGFAVEVIGVDHQNKPDVGAAIAMRWYDREQVDVILDVPGSAIALAVSGVTRERNKVFLPSSAATADLTGTACSPNTIYWTYDTYMLARSTGGALVRAGGDRWFFLTANYAFGHALQRDATAFVREAGGAVLGAAAYPFPGTTEFSSYLVRAQASGANVLGLANAGADTANCIKQAQEFGLTRRMKVAALLLGINDVKAIGLGAAQGLYLTESFYWDLNDRTRAWSRRVLPKTPNHMPSMAPAGCYAATMHYLKAVAELGPDRAKANGAAVVAHMKATSVEDDCFGNYTIRADGRALVPAHLFQVKTPQESRSPWDLYKLVATMPGEQAFRPLDQGGCAFIRS